MVHRQLIAALARDFPIGGVTPSPETDGGSSPPQQSLMRHAELAEVAAHVNATHRQAKRAQKDCSDLYLLLLLHKCVASVCCRCSFGM